MPFDNHCPGSEAAMMRFVGLILVDSTVDKRVTGTSERPSAKIDGKRAVLDHA